MGCAECKLLRQLKREPYIEQLVGVDFDPMPLKMNEHIVHPLTTDYLMPRTNPLRVTLMQGKWLYQTTMSKEISEAQASFSNNDIHKVMSPIMQTKAYKDGYTY